MKYFCNPVNINYRYQFNKDLQSGHVSVNREAADPSMIMFRGRYYIFASMTLGVWISDDLVSWENHRLPDTLPLYDYAPDVRVIGDYVYISASKADGICNFYRTKDVLNGPYEIIDGSMTFWDPNLFIDDDGRLYLYWGCSSESPIYGVELDKDTMEPIGEKNQLICGHPFDIGFERVGENNSLFPKTEAEIDAAVSGFVESTGGDINNIPADIMPVLRGMFSQKPFIEGAWMDKHNGKYYLQYAAPGTEYNTYADGVYVGDSPLGPFKLANNNPYSYHPGGFIPGAGHGSTMRDKHGNYWHASTMRISVNHQFERRVGIWPAGFDKDEELFCNQRYGDWPRRVADRMMDPWEEPEWYLLSYGKKTFASSYVLGKGPEKAVDENVKDWWQADSEKAGEWLVVDLGAEADVHAIQVNFADDNIITEVPKTFVGEHQPRYIDDSNMYTRYLLESSSDGTNYELLADRTASQKDLSHDCIYVEDGRVCRYIKLTVMEVPYNQRPCISGLRVFGKGHGMKPYSPIFNARRIGDLDMEIEMNSENATGYQVLWGHAPEKLYHSYLTYEKGLRIGALIKGQIYYVRVDAFNENGITEGQTIPLKSD